MQRKMETTPPPPNLGPLRGQSPQGEGELSFANAMFISLLRGA